MAKLKDYSGEFIPNLSFTYFSYDALVELLEIYCKFYWAMDGNWFMSIKERTNGEEALACDLMTLEKMVRYEMHKMREDLDASASKLFRLLHSC